MTWSTSPACCARWRGWTSPATPNPPPGRICVSSSGSPPASSRMLAPLSGCGSSARGCEVAGTLLQEGFELLEEFVAGGCLCLFDEFGDVAQLQVAEAIRG